ncbi:ELO family [Scleroderma yunnanense]
MALYIEIIPIPRWTSMVYLFITYLSAVFGIRKVMKYRAPFRSLYTAFRIHDLINSVASLMLAMLLGMEVWSIWKKMGAYNAICSEEAFTPRIELYLKLNLYLKCYELGDTIFMASLKKHITGYHIYHHITVAILAFVQLDGRVTVYWVAALLSLYHHALAYYSCYLAFSGSKPWWSKHLMTQQILHTKIILFCSIFGASNYYVDTYLPELPHIGSCAGTETAAIVGIGIASSYLFFAKIRSLRRFLV